MQKPIVSTVSLSDSQADHIECDIRLQRPNFELRVRERISTQGITAIFGPSGCGKSSFLRSIAGLEKGVTGRIRLGDETWLDSENKAVTKTASRGIGLVFQQANLFPHLNVSGNLRYGLRRCKQRPRQIEWDDVVRWLDLAELLERPVHALSGGEQQRVAIGRALLSQPKLLLLDEPLSGVDWARRHEIMPFLERLHRALHIPMILVSHQLEEVARLADWVLNMQQGKITRRGPVHEMLGYLSATGAEPYSILIGTVTAWNEDDKLTVVSTTAGNVWLPGRRGVIGSTIRLLLQASDISLSLAPFGQLSILNQLSASITDIEQRGDDQLITLVAGDTSLFALLSYRAVRQMQLRLGLEVIAMVKSASVMSAE